MTSAAGGAASGHEGGTEGHVTRLSGHDPAEYGEWKVWAKNPFSTPRIAWKPPEALGAELLDLLIPVTPASEAAKELKESENEFPEGAQKI